MLLPSAVHVSSTFEFGAVFHDCLSADPQGNPPFSTLFRSPMNCVFVHVSSTFEFGAMRSDCLVQFSILNPFSEPHECHCLALFMCPPLSSAKPLVTGKYVLLLFSRSVPSPNMCICVYVYYVRCSCCCLYFVLCRRKKKE